MSSELLVLVVLIMLNAFFAASEMALVSVNDNKIKHLAEEGNKKAKTLDNLIGEPSKFLATIQIGITLAGFLASAFAAGSFAGQLADFIYQLGVPISKGLLNNIAVIIVTLILSYFTLVLGELVPKRLAMQRAEAIAFLVAHPLSWLSLITSPVVKLLTFSTNLVVRLFGVDPNADSEEVTEEEIRMMVDVGKERGAIQEAEKVMINNIFEFDNKMVVDIMTHRTEITAIPIHHSLKQVASIMSNGRYTRVPVYEDNIDNIIGTLNVKELIRFMEACDETTFDLKKLIRKPYFVLTLQNIDDVFREMQKKKMHMAIVIDEYGGTAGIVTMEDLLEEIVGNIFDEYDVDEKEIEQLDDNTFLMSGIVSLYEVKEFLGVALPVEDYETLSGFLISQLGHIPAVGEQPELEYNGLVFKVQEVNRKRIVKVKVCRS
ncbi:hemolysin family protein [Peptococcaceae bacterium 1198_IL3148]